MRRTLALLGTTTITVGAIALAAAPAHALPPPTPVLVAPAVPALVWVQSFQRPSEDTPCVPPPELDIPWQSDWAESEKAWIPTWEQWANGGTGGWTCLRLITWGKGSAAVYELPLD